MAYIVYYKCIILKFYIFNGLSCGESIVKSTKMMTKIKTNFDFVTDALKFPYIKVYMTYIFKLGTEMISLLVDY